MARIYHLNCGTLRPRSLRLEAVVYCLLVETSGGLLLVDTGLGLQDYARPTRLVRLFRRWLGVPGDVSETAVLQVSRLGFAADDVRHVVLTHLHLDHAGGLPDFPNAQVHVYRPEYEAAIHPRGLMERFYEPAHWAHGPNWVLHEARGDRWFGLDCISVVPALEPPVLLVPLVGHTRGHCGVAVATGDGWLLQAGDAVSPYHRATDIHDLPAALQPLNWVPDWVAPRLIGPHVPRLRQLVRQHRESVQVVSGHDLYSLRRNRTAGAS